MHSTQKGVLECDIQLNPINDLHTNATCYRCVTMFEICLKYRTKNAPKCMTSTYIYIHRACNVFN